MNALTDDEDAFGHLVHDYLHGEQGLETVERDDGFLGTAGTAHPYFAPYHEWPPHEQASMAWVRSRVLDIGCGAGRHALYLQEQGHKVTGIDCSPGAIAVCKQRGLRDARILDIGQVGRESGRWDTLLLLGANFGLLGSTEEARAILARFHAATGIRGRIIAESRDPATITEPIHVAYQETNRQRGRLPGQLRMRIRYRGRATPWFEYLFVSKGELDHLLDGTGWRATRYVDAQTEVGAYIALIEKDGSAKAVPVRGHGHSMT